MAMAAPGRDRPGLAGPPPAARGDRGPTTRRTSRSARPTPTACWVCLFDDDGNETRPPPHRAHPGRLARRVPDVPVGSCYGFRVTARGTPRTARGSTPPSCCSTPTPGRSRRRRDRPGDAGLRRRRPDGAQRRRLRAAHAPRASSSHDDFDWAGDVPLRTRWRDTVIYELHVQGLHRSCTTGSPSSCAARTPASARPASSRYLERPRRHARSSCCRCTSSSPSRRSPPAG